MPFDLPHLIGLSERRRSRGSGLFSGAHSACRRAANSKLCLNLIEMMAQWCELFIHVGIATLRYTPRDPRRSGPQGRRQQRELQNR
eukprot:1268285-Pyramimonas_sp.AAC.1